MASIERYEARIDELWLLQEYNEVPLAVMPTEDRTVPIYEVYKNGTLITAATPELQWMARDIAETHGIPERFIFALITLESTWNPRTVNERGPWIGLTQMSGYWKTARTLTEYRLTDRHRDYDLYDPYDNLLSATEMWLYGIDNYDIDPATDLGIMRLAYFHSTGKNPDGVTGESSHPGWHSSYYNHLLRFMGEMAEIQHTAHGG